jgi:mannose-1-phosphate guanylyltransferase
VKAFLLAAGVGSRLRPITDLTPKCMLDIDGKPLLDIWFDSFGKAGVDEVLVNLHHLPDVVRDHLAARTGSPTVRAVHEPELLGSAGTLLANRQWVAGEEFFLACNADNLTDFDLRTLIDAHAANGGIATLTLFHSPNPSSGGVVELDGAGRVAGFTEKPSHPVSDLTNAGIYAFRPDVLDEIDAVSNRPGPTAAAPPPRDIGYDLLPRLVGRARAVLIDGYFRDIGTPDAYRLARQEWPVRAGR